MSQILSDNFQYTDGDLHTENPNWIEGLGTFTVSGNVVFARTSGAGGNLAYRTDVTWPDDQYSEITYTVNDSLSNNGGGPATRASSNNGYVVQLVPSSSGAQLFKLVNGIKTSISAVGSIVGPNTGDVFRLTVQGATLSLTQNSTVVKFNGLSSITDSTFLSGSAGIWGTGFPGFNSVGFSSWSAGSLSAPSNFVPVTPLHVEIKSQQITYLQPPPVLSVSEQIPNTTTLNVLSVTSSAIDNPGFNQSPIPDSFPRVADPWTVNPNLTQYFPCNAPPAP